MNDKLGQLASLHAKRDAIHIAIAPVVAGERLDPGDLVGFRPDGTVGRAAGNKVGIVDPFLPGNVKIGDRFFLMLFQGTIMGMRHHWTHPSFSDSDEKPSDAPVSREWIRGFASRLGVSYDQLMQGAEDGDLCFGDTGHDWNSFEDEFWTHYKAVTGKQGSGENFFRCAC